MAGGPWVGAAQVDAGTACLVGIALLESGRPEVNEAVEQAYRQCLAAAPTPEVLAKYFEERIE